MNKVMDVCGEIYILCINLQKFITAVLIGMCVEKFIFTVSTCKSSSQLF
jgi:hypothetical protein